MQLLTDFSQLIQKLQQKCIVITPNKRLSMVLEQKYAQSLGLEVLEKPQIMPYSHFLLHQYQALSVEHELPLLLNHHQAYEIWSQTISANTDAFNIDGLIQDVQKAWSHCHQWQLPVSKKDFTFSEESQKFQQWCDTYQQRLADIKAIDEPMLYNQIKPYLPCDNAAIVWALFDDFTPEQNALMQCYAQHNIETYAYDIESQNNDSAVFAAEDQEHELSAVIEWAKQKRAQGLDDIGIVIPELSQNHQALIRKLNNHFEPGDYNVSMGKTLSSYPIVSQALSLLRLSPPTLDAIAIRLILNSPFIGEAKSEFLQRIECYNQLDCLKEPALSLSYLIEQLTPLCPKLAKRIKTIEQLDDSLKLTPSFWVNHFKKYLNALGYPGEQGLDSHDYQCFKRLELLFDEFAQLDLVKRRIKRTTALKLLTRLAEKTLFQPQSKQEPIQILGLLEAAGLEFNALWVMGMTDACLPQAPKLSPFIPYPLQQSNNMPHSSAQKELSYAKQLITRLSKSAPQCVFSYPAFIDDEHTQASPLLSHYKTLDFELCNEQTIEAKPLELIQESDVIAIGVNEKIRGGTFILKDQALCPFRAFAKHRLKADNSICEVTGLDPLDRGLLIHRVLELVWGVLKTQAKLLAIDDTALSTLINQAIDNAMAPLIKERPTTMNETFQSLEKKRLFKLTKAWLELEKERPPFEVAEIEEWQQLQLANLTINMRVDRLDKLATGEKWVVDYKTGNPSVNEWFDERSSEPQLPLYSLCDEEITGLVFAQLKTGNLRLKGVAENTHDVAGITAIEKKADSWDEQRALWHEQMTLLAEEFLEGKVSISPKKASVCAMCECQSLCRINYSGVNQ